MNNKKMIALLIAIVTFSAISAMIEDTYEETDEVAMPETDYPTEDSALARNGNRKKIITTGIVSGDMSSEDASIDVSDEE